MGGGASKKHRASIADGQGAEEVKEHIAENTPTQELSPNDKIIVLGGTGYAETAVEVYNPNDLNENELFQKQLGVLGWHGHIAGYLDGKIYIAASSGMFPESTSIVDPTTLETTEGPELNVGHRSAAGVVHDDALFIFGGVGCQIVEMLKPGRKWAKICEMEETCFDGAAVSVGEKIYLVGGVVAGRSIDNASRAVQIFTPSSKWKQGPKLPYKRTQMAAEFLNASIITTGGADHDGELSKKCWRLDPRDKKWEQISSMNETRAGHELVNFDDRLFAFGGKDTNKRSTRTVEEYDARADKWVDTKEMFLERSSFATVVIIH